MASSMTIPKIFKVGSFEFNQMCTLLAVRRVGAHTMMVHIARYKLTSPMTIPKNLNRNAMSLEFNLKFYHKQSIVHEYCEVQAVGTS